MASCFALELEGSVASLSGEVGKLGNSLRGAKHAKEHVEAQLNGLQVERRVMIETLAADLEQLESQRAEVAEVQIDRHAR